MFGDEIINFNQIISSSEEHIFISNYVLILDGGSWKEIINKRLSDLDDRQIRLFGKILTIPPLNNLIKNGSSGQQIEQRH